MGEAVAILGLMIGIMVVLALCVALPIYLFNKQYKEIPKQTQWKISDKEILILISKQLDQLISADQLAEQTSLSKSEAKSRLASLAHYRAIKAYTTNRLKYVYSLKEKIDDRLSPKLSNKPYITKEDLMQLFAHYDYRLNMHKLCFATGLPAPIILKELKRFIKEKIVYSISDQFFNTTFLLSEPYRSNPEKHLHSEVEFNLDLSKIYEKEMKNIKR